MCLLCDFKASRRQVLRGGMASLAAVGLAANAQVDVGPPSTLRKLVSAEQIEGVAAKQYTQMMASAQEQRALYPVNHPQVRRLREIARRLLDELAKPVAYGADRLTVTISIGVALYPRHASNFTTLYKAADEMLYKVKGRGRSGSAVCGEDGELSSSARLQLDVLNVPSGLS